MVTEIVKDCVARHDIKRLKYIFVDCLDVDPTFDEYKDDYEYCINTSGLGLLEEHMDLTPMRKDKNSWDISYWNSLKMDLIKNFSVERFAHMREVAQVVHAEKIKRLSIEMEQKRAEEERKREIEVQREERKKWKEQAANSGNRLSARQQNEQVERDKTQLALENAKTAEKIKEEQNQRAQRRQQYESSMQTRQEDRQGKKAVGIVVAVLIIAIIIIVLLILNQ